MSASARRNDELKAVSVLVLDDEEAVRRFMTATLTEAGCNVQTAAHGREGLNLVLNHDYDVVVVDMRMEQMDGLTFLQETQKIWPWLGFVVATAYPEDERVQQARELGVRHVLQKPVAKEDLIAAVADEARHKKAHDQQPRGLPREKFQHQMAVLRRLGESAVNHENPTNALRDFSEGLGRHFACSAVGLLELEGDERLLILAVREPVAEEFLAHMRKEMLARLQAFRGRPVDEAKFLVRIEGAARVAGGPAAPASAIIVPLMLGGELHGLIMLASTRPNAFSWMEISFLYQAANQFSTVRLAINRMRQLAIHDPLTGLYNRRRLETELEQAWQLAARYDHDVSVAILDIDAFKQINDAHGHLVGDQVLVEFAQVIRDVVRATDIVGRYGGDEFVVVLPKTGIREAVVFGQRLLQALRDHAFCEESLRIRLTPSMGIAGRRNAQAPASSGELLNQADAALLAAKRTGRDMLLVWPPDQQAREAAPNPAGAEETPLAPRGRVLVVDDEEPVLRMVTRMLERERYEIATESTSAGALALLAQRPSEFDVVLTDLQLAGESGIDLLHRLEALDRTIIKVVITGHATIDNAVASLRSGAYDFVEKPIVAEKLLAVLDRALKLRKLQRENERYKLFLEEMVRQKSASLSHALNELRRAYEFTLEALVAMLDAREHDTARHSVRVRELALIVGREMNLSPAELDDVGRGALLHDIGKIAIPDAILLKKGPLTDEEWTIIRTHPEIGHRIVSSSPHLRNAAEIVLSHHERFDGTGYPRNLKGQDICLGARIFAVVDAYDTMRSRRCYKIPYSPDHAVDQLKRHSGTQFDPAIVEVCLRCQDKLEAFGQWNP